MSSRKKAAQDKPELTNTRQQLLKQLEEMGVSRSAAEDLVLHSDPNTIGNWIEVIGEDQSIQDRPAYLVQALRGQWQLPKSFYRKEAKQREAELKEQERKRLESCVTCQGKGFYQVDNTTVALCTHNGLRKKTAPKRRGPNIDLVWEQTLQKLRGQLPKPTYATCKDTKLLGMDGNIAIIQAPSQSTVERLERLYQSIAKALGEVMDQEVEVEFVVSEETSYSYV
jgi:hypothetical protein